MENLVFNFSNEVIHQRKKRMFLMTFLMIFAMIFFIFYLTDMNDSEDLMIMGIILAIVIPLLVIEVLVLSRFMFKRLRETKLILEEEGFIRISGKYKEGFRYGDIQSIKVVRNKSKNIEMVKIKTTNKNLNLFGLDDMEAIIQLLKDRLSEGVTIKEKEYKINWNNPFVIIGVMIITVLFLAILMNANMIGYRIFNTFFTLGIGLFFMLYRPISRNAGSRFKLFETILGIVLIFSSGSQIISDILEFFAF